MRFDPNDVEASERPQTVQWSHENKAGGEGADGSQLSKQETVNQMLFGDEYDEHVDLHRRMGVSKREYCNLRAAETETGTLVC